MTIPDWTGTFTETFVDNPDTTSRTITKPSGGTTDDIYLIAVSAYDNDGTNSPVASCSGFTQIGYVRNASINQWNQYMNSTVLARRYTGTEGSTFNVTFSEQVGGYLTISCGIIRDVDPALSITNALDGTVGTATHNGTGGNLPAVTTTQANSGAFAHISSSSSPIYNGPNGWTEDDTADSGYSNLYSKDMATAGSTGTDDADNGNTQDRWTMIVWAFKEETVGGGFDGSYVWTPSGKRRLRNASGQKASLRDASGSRWEV